VGGGRGTLLRILFFRPDVRTQLVRQVVGGEETQVRALVLVDDVLSPMRGARGCGEGAMLQWMFGVM